MGEKPPFPLTLFDILPSEIPVVAPTGEIFDLLAIIPYLNKYGINPNSCEKLDPKDLITLNLTTDGKGKYRCPITLRVFTPQSHVVCIKPTGNVFSIECVKDMHLGNDNFKDILTDEFFLRTDIIDLQKPIKNSAVKFKVDANNKLHISAQPQIKLNLDTKETEGTVSLLYDNMASEQTPEKDRGRDMRNEKSSAAVQSSIEWMVEDLIKQICSGSGNQLKLRLSIDETCKQLHYNNSSSLRKLAVNCSNLSQIYHLITSQQQSSLRDLFYDKKQLYRKQYNLTRSVSDICEVLGVSRSHLNVTASSRGLVFGLLSLAHPKEFSHFDCTKEPQLISEKLLHMIPSSQARFIIVVEKDAIFQKLISQGFMKLYPKSILVTAKGYPDLVSRQFLSRLASYLKIPIGGLFDGDGSGMEIFLTYKYGSGIGRAEEEGAVVPSMTWMGVKASDRFDIPIPDCQLYPMSSQDYEKISRVKNRAATLNENEIVQEAEIFLRHKFMMGIEAISTSKNGVAYLLTSYFLPRIRKLLSG